MKETIQKIIEFITPIPEEKWLINAAWNNDRSKRCVLGHLKGSLKLSDLVDRDINHNIRPFIRDLARANNGSENDDRFYFSHAATKFDRFKSPKTRSIKFLESLLVNDGWKRYL